MKSIRNTNVPLSVPQNYNINSFLFFTIVYKIHKFAHSPNKVNSLIDRGRYLWNRLNEKTAS